MDGLATFWWVLPLALLFVLGGLLTVRPSRAQRRIARLRTAAMGRGLLVYLPFSLRFPPGIGVALPPGAFYCLPIGEVLELPPIVYLSRRIVATGGAENAATAAGFLASTKIVPLQSVLDGVPNCCAPLDGLKPATVLRLQAVLEGLPDCCHSLYLGAGLAAIGWDESGDECVLGELVAALETIAVLFSVG